MLPHPPQYPSGQCDQHDIGNNIGCSRDSLTPTTRFQEREKLLVNSISAIGSPIGQRAFGRLYHDVSEPQVYTFEAAHSAHDKMKKTAKPLAIRCIRPEGTILIRENKILMRAALNNRRVKWHQWVWDRMEPTKSNSCMKTMSTTPRLYAILATYTKDDHLGARVFSDIVKERIERKHTFWQGQYPSRHSTDNIET